MTHVLVADDHALFRAGLRQFLVDALPSAEIGEAASGNEVLTCLQRKSWDMLILDINMPDRSGLDILRHVKSGHPATRVLVLSGYPERQYALNVLRAGAAGYIAKDAAPEDLLKAVRTVLQGHRYVSESLAELLLLDLDRATSRCTHCCPTGSSRSSASWPQDAGFRRSDASCACQRRPSAPIGRASWKRCE